jgi:hypothetical protein
MASITRSRGRKPLVEDPDMPLVERDKYLPDLRIKYSISVYNSAVLGGERYWLTLEKKEAQRVAARLIALLLETEEEEQRRLEEEYRPVSTLTPSDGRAPLARAEPLSACR